MKRSLLLGWACMLGVLLFAQDDPVLMRINGKDVLRSEFEQSYRNYSKEAGEKMTPKEYAELFVNRKLKLGAAKAMGLDSLSSFRKQQATYRASLLKSYLMDEQVTDSCARARYDKMKGVGKHAEKVQIMQIFKYLPQNLTSRRLEAERARMDSIYRVIGASPNTEFDRLVDLFSDDKQCVWIEHLQTASEFEDVAFSLMKGEVSKPFLSPMGIHILKVIDRKEMPTYETVSSQFTERVRRSWGLDKGTEALVERLKRQYQYTPNAAGVAELLAKGETEQTLFTLDGTTYSGTMFKRFASSYPQALKRQLNGFVAKSILDYESKNVLNKHPEISRALCEYEEGVLLSQLTFQKVDSLADNDRAALATYFKFHQSDYRWKTPRYKGAVLHCADKKIAKQAKKLLKKRPEKEWKDAIRKTLNASGVEAVKVEQGIFADGDNKYIDKLVFKKGGFEPVKSNPFTIVVGRKMKGPDDYREVIEQVRKDYRTYLDVCWMRELRASGKVEINQEVLKTVNNS